MKRGMVRGYSLLTNQEKIQPLIDRGYIKTTPYGIFYFTGKAGEIEGSYNDLSGMLDEIIKDMDELGFKFNSEVQSDEYD